MKAYDSLSCRLVKKAQLTADIFDFTFYCPPLSKISKPGQFAQIKVPGHSLRRPISICGADGVKGELRFVFQIRGQGTLELSALKPGDDAEILAPLGKGFPIDAAKKTLLVGGGIGVPPMLSAASALKESAVAVLGFRSKAAVILEDDFKSTGAKTVIATDDGSYGFNGLVTQAAKGESFERVFACGPMPMLRAVKEMAEKSGAECYLSLEERMACGIGACLGCAVALKDETREEGFYYGHVCRDGPVFNSSRLVL